jgi:hypothetical protein
MGDWKTEHGKQKEASPLTFVLLLWNRCERNSPEILTPVFCFLYSSSSFFPHL